MDLRIIEITLNNYFCTSRLREVIVQTQLGQGMAPKPTPRESRSNYTICIFIENAKATMVMTISRIAMILLIPMC